ncbi:hypothetical protein [Yinghuangia soli]|uniref:Excreted virulence factor EspC (Type VII ESX diderm) n=1 Tax=Yinghuangia soli TaxID=2908204 RepID=A0AA41U0I7_9ACTN|nr:hypothetical protein [Yinghuangia soli]MCF2526457.1 hypothetical protein [Yinghuangia soli]
MRADPAVLRAASAGAREIAADLPRLTDRVAESARAAAAGCPGFATAAALVDVATAWQARLVAAGGSFARTADNLAATAQRDEQTDRTAAAAFDAAGG